MLFRDRQTLTQAWNEGQRPEFLMFWGRKGGDTSAIGPYVFSQWHFSDFDVNGIVYPTAEHYMMAEKAWMMGDEETFNAILRDADTGSPLGVPDPARAKKLGRRVKNWDQEKWDASKFGVVVDASVAKFGQIPEMRDYLLGTGHKVLVEASPHDKVWGIGLRREDSASKDPNKWKGQNLLGFALMEARDRLRGTPDGVSEF